MTMQEITNYIPVGKQNAVHQEALAALLNVKPAAIKKMIREARQQGAPICSGQCGYWQAETSAEKELFIKSMRKQAITRFTTIKGMNIPNDKIDGQINLLDIIE